MNALIPLRFMLSAIAQHNVRLNGMALSFPAESQP